MSKTALVLVVFSATLLVVPFSQALGAVDAYLKIDGIPGLSTAQTGSIDILSFSWGVSQPATAASGQASGKRQHQTLTVRKTVDSASPKLRTACANGQHFKQVTLTTYPRASQGQEPVVQVTKLTDVIISSERVVNNSQAGERPVEEISFTFTKIETISTPLRGTAAVAPLQRR
jgi:type VI secretion system secreted protein Hcp